MFWRLRLAAHRFRYKRDAARIARELAPTHPSLWVHQTSTQPTGPSATSEKASPENGPSTEPLEGGAVGQSAGHSLGHLPPEGDSPKVDATVHFGVFMGTPEEARQAADEIGRILVERQRSPEPPSER